MKQAVTRQMMSTQMPLFGGAPAAPKEKKVTMGAEDALKVFAGEVEWPTT